MEVKEEKPLLCDICCKAFLTLDEFNAHMEKEHQKKTVSVCSGHEKLLNVEASNEKVQWKIVEDKKPQICDVCDEVFTDLDSFIAHKEVHRNEQFFVCADCNRIFTVEDDLNEHLETHNVPDVIQPEVGVLKTLPASNFFSQHLNELLERPFELQSRTLKKQSKMEGRQQRRTVLSFHSRLGQLHLCNKCGKSFPRRYQLTCHKILQKYNRFRCMARKCSKNVTASTLYGHAHEYQCSNPFTKKSIRAKHVESHSHQQNSRSIEGIRWKFHFTPHPGIQVGERSYECDQCDRSFKQKSHLKYHLRMHNGERPFPCELCDKAFIQKSHLKYHLRLHTGEKPF